jgi:hypothetical protein
VRGKRLDITLTGKGQRGGITVNGKKFKGATIHIPFAELKMKNSIVI